MKRILLAATMIVAALTLSSCFTRENKIKVISYNIRLSGLGHARGADGIHYWDNRRHASINMINDEKPTVFGLQEACSDQIDFLVENLPDYDHIGVGRDDGKRAGEFMAIFYRKDMVELLDGGTFWLSETPEKVSQGWDAACRRTCTWTRMRMKASGDEFIYLNTHLDHLGAKAQEESVKLIVERVKPYLDEELPIFITADFNLTPESPFLTPLREVMDDARDVADQTDNRGTFNGWNTVKGNVIIDHIFLKNAEAHSFKVLCDKNYGAPLISDHYPVVLEASF